MTLYKNKYRIESTRLKGCDYASAGYYFITICTKNRKCWFGEIIPASQRFEPPQMKSSNIGKIVHNEWLKTFSMRPDMNLKMDKFVIMPNHFHAIIHIG